MADAGVADATLESAVDEPVLLKEQMVLPQVLEGMVGHAVRPPSPLVVPPTTEEEDEVEEIEREELRPQAVRILRKHGDVVVVLEEDTTRDLRGLESTLVRVMK